jgi:hypothetical protein
MSNNDGLGGLFWPEIDDAQTAKSVSRLGVWAAVVVCLWGTGVVTYGVLKADSNLAPYGVLAYVDAAIFAVLAWGIWRLRRAAAVIALLLFVLEQALAALRTGSMVGLVMPVVLTLFFISGVRGTFAYRKYSTASEGEAPSTSA